MFRGDTSQLKLELRTPVAGTPQAVKSHKDAREKITDMDNESIDDTLENKSHRAPAPPRTSMTGISK